VLRDRVLAEEPYCWICGDEIDPTLSGRHRMGGTGDHVVPLEGGGTLLDRDNVRAAHNVCNRERHVTWRRGRRAVARTA
jgi:5-methylcytosine-specific restriction endonuclease McrA